MRLFPFLIALGACASAPSGSDPRIQELLKGLEDRDPNVRKRCEEELESLGKSVEEAARRFQRMTGSPVARGHIERVLRSIALQDLLGAESGLRLARARTAVERVENLTAIGSALRLNRREWGYLARLLISDLTQGQERIFLAVAIERKKARVCGPVLVALLEDPDPEVRQAALDALGHLGAAEFSDEIIPLLEDGDPAVRRAAIDALVRLLGSKAAGLLRAAMERDQSPAVREKLRLALQGLEMKPK